MSLLIGYIWPESSLGSIIFDFVASVYSSFWSWFNDYFYFSGDSFWPSNLSYDTFICSDPYNSLGVGKVSRSGVGIWICTP